MIGLVIGFISGYWLGKKHEREKLKEARAGCCYHRASYSEYSALIEESRRLRKEACRLRKEATRARANPPFQNNQGEEEV